MQVKRAWTIKSFITCFLVNGLLVGGFYLAARELLSGIHQWVDPLLENRAADLPENAELALGNFMEFINQAEYYLAPVVLGTGAGITLLLWLVLQFQGRRSINRAFREAALFASEKPPEVSEKKEEEPSTPKPSEPRRDRYTQPSPGAAIQMLSLLQRQGRLIDFLQEDLSLYEDAQIGAAVRNIHEGCKTAIAEHVQLEPIFKEEEGAEVKVSSGFDSNAVRLTGNVVGDPPFRGTLRHRGWRAVRIELPRPTSDQKEDWIVAPAEVELE